MPHQAQLEAAYTEMCLDRLDLGFEPVLITLMFNPLPGSQATVARTMEQVIEKMYGDVVRNMFRHPGRKDLLELPLWIACPDYPVNKSNKMTIRETTVNSGMHTHIPAMVPTGTRLELPFNLWLEENKHLYCGPGKAVARIHVLRIYETPEDAFRYAFKSLGRGRANSDDVLVLPRTHSEMQSRKQGR
jgi:hypothetical protein